jgi:hypothetical protein
MWAGLSDCWVELKCDNASMPRNAAGLALLILTLHGTGGCATVAVWRWACNDSVSPREVTGILIPENAGLRSIVIAYGPFEKESTLLVPIDGKGKPVAPYGYLGGTADEFWVNVSNDQWAWEVYHNPAIRLGTVMPTSKPTQSPASQESMWMAESPLVAIGYRIDSKNRITLVSIVEARGDPSRCNIVLLPRSYGRLNNNRAPAAILATPFAIAVDAVVTPIILPIAVLFVLGTHGGAI